MEVRSVPYQEPFRNETKGSLERTNVKHGLIMSLDPITFFSQFFYTYEGHPIKNETFFIIRKSVCVFSQNSPYL